MSDIKARIKDTVPFFMIAWAAILLFSRPSLLEYVRHEKISEYWLFIGPAVFLILAFISTPKKTPTDYLPVAFGVLLAAVLFPSSLREYKTAKIKNPIDLYMLKEFSQNKDARIRALALLATPRNNLKIDGIGSLIHRGLLDKDPLVQQAARMVIEDNLGIRLKSGAEGISQAQELISALQLQTGEP